MKSDSHKKLASLIKKHLENSLSEEDVKELDLFLNDCKNEQSFSEILSSELNEYELSQDDDNEEHYSRVFGRIKGKVMNKQGGKAHFQNPSLRISVRKILIQAVSMAAVFMLAFFIGNQSSIMNFKNEMIAQQNKDVNIISTPYGAISKVILPDSTEIIINAGSTVRYLNSYNISNRTIELEGEAFFRVRGLSDSPFIVDAGDIAILAKGTEFNVKAYPDESVIETTLVEGSVEIFSLKENDGMDMKVLDLASNQKAIFIKASDSITLERIREQDPAAIKVVAVAENSLLLSDKTDINQSTAWTNNELLIRSEKLESLVIKLHRKYNAEFEFMTDEIKSYRFTGLLRDEPLDQVLNAICLSAPISFHIDGKTVVLMSR